MADNVLQFGIAVRTDAASASLAQVNAAIAETTTAAASHFTQASTTISLSLQKVAEDAGTSAGRTKEQIEKASAAAGAFGDVLGTKVPEGLQKMLGQSELIGPVLEKAFAPLAVIQLLQWVAEATDKVSKWIGDTIIYTEEMRQHNDSLIALNRQFIEVARQRADAETELFRITHTAGQNAQRDLDGTNSKIGLVNDKIDKQKVLIQNAEQALAKNIELWKVYGGAPQVSLDAENQKIQDLKNTLDLYMKEKAALGAVTQLQQEQLRQAENQDAERRKAEAERRREAAQAAYEAFQQKQMKAFMDGLQAKQDALDAFHTLSKQDEANYWAEMLKQTRQGSDNERQVRHLMTEAQKAADREAAQAQQAAYDKSANVILDTVREQVNAAKSGSQQRVQAEQNLLSWIELLYGEESEQFKQQKAKMLAAQQQYDEQSKQDAMRAADVRARIQEIDAESDKRHWEARKALEQAGLDFERQLGRMSEDEYEKHLQQLLADTYQHEREDLQIKLNAAKQSTEEYARIRAEMKKLDDKYLADVENAERKSYERRHQAMLAFIRQGVAVHQQLEHAFVGDLNNMNASLASFITTGKANWAQLASSRLRRSSGSACNGLSRNC